MLLADGSQPAPSFARPELPPNAQSVADGGNFVVEAEFMAGPAQSGTPLAYGVFVRGLKPPATPRSDGSQGVWRAGLVGGNAFILGEPLLGAQTPSDLLASKAATVPNSPRPGQAPSLWVKIRLEVRGHQYSIAINDMPLLSVADPRFDDGTSIGVWSDRTRLSVRDFRLYSLAE
jgi:hypothetical protein